MVGGKAPRRLPRYPSRRDEWPVEAPQPPKDLDSLEAEQQQLLLPRTTADLITSCPSEVLETILIATADTASFTSAEAFAFGHGDAESFAL